MEKSIDELQRQVDRLNDKIIQMSTAIEKIITQLVEILPTKEEFRKEIQ